MSRADAGQHGVGPSDDRLQRACTHHGSHLVSVGQGVRDDLPSHTPRRTENSELHTFSTATAAEV